jgi:hypothetical protein
MDLASALGITVRLFDSQSEMYATRVATDTSANPDSEGSFYRKGPGAGGKGAEGTIFGLNPGATTNDGKTVSGIDALSTLLHEIAHGMTLGPLDLKGPQAMDTPFINPVTGQPDKAPDGSFAMSALRPLLEGRGDPDIMSEIDNLQSNVDIYTTKDPSQRNAVREIRQLAFNLNAWKVYLGRQVARGAMAPSEAALKIDDNQAKAEDYTQYMQSVRELAVDPVLVYLMNPKLAKSVMPKTAALIKNEFTKGKNPTITFHGMSFPIVIATVMAMLAQGAAEEEEENQKMQQMASGALSPQEAPPGLLTQAA